MEIDLVILLTILALFFTILIPIFLKVRIPTRNKDIELPLKGMGFLSAIAAWFMYITAAAGSVDLSKTYVFVGSDTYLFSYPYGWVFAALLVMASFIPFLLILFLIPESWKDVDK